VAVRALLDITPWNVEAAPGHATVGARVRCGPAAEAFASILDPSERLPANPVVRQCLRTFDFWPPLGHAELLSRIMLVLNTLAVTRAAAVERGFHSQPDLQRHLSLNESAPRRCRHRRKIAARLKVPVTTVVEACRLVVSGTPLGRGISCREHCPKHKHGSLIAALQLGSSP
jgi:hypothetical protein